MSHTQAPVPTPVPELELLRRDLDQQLADGKRFVPIGAVLRALKRHDNEQCAAGRPLPAQAGGAR